MRKIKILLAVIMAITCCGAIYAKDSVEVSTKEYAKTEAETKPKGKAIIAVFTNFNTTLSTRINIKNTTLTIITINKKLVPHRL